MRNLSLFTGIAVIIFLTSCGNNSTSETIYVPQKSDSNIIVTSPLDTSIVPAINTNVITNNAPNVSTPVLITQPNVQPIQPTTVAAGMNPEHGKPGHRCDIAVGAPLNSTAKQPQPTTSITPTITNTPEISAKNATIVTTSETASGKTAAGMNPEHGKPGHRCDIAVGAPLNSKPAEAKPTQPTIVSSGVPSNVKSDASVTTPITPLLPSNTEKAVKEGMNPEHGKPGHRCEIAVGAPLPKQ